ncbi:MAG: DUF4298 domain-containing protein [Lachnospiraceae bacterium]|nr:DUF4298 domain-containing protein [Lachnospiraceae bacterium]
MSESRVDRIRKMETILDDANRAIDEFESTYEKLADMQKKIKKLEEYYTGGQWLKDYEADEAGKIPADLKRGVLSQDAVSDLLDRNRDIFKLLGKKDI